MKDGLSDRMIRNEKELIVFMPLRKNVPNPSRDWKPRTCPKCGQECWYNTSGDEMLKLLGQKIRLLCTECALKER